MPEPVTDVFPAFPIVPLKLQPPAPTAKTKESPGVTAKAAAQYEPPPPPPPSPASPPAPAPQASIRTLVAGKVQLAVLMPFTQSAARTVNGNSSDVATVARLSKAFRIVFIFETF
jgi:hypothetical protein